MIGTQITRSGAGATALSESTRALMRWTPIVLVMAVIGYGIGSFAVPAAKGAEATAVLVLTDEVSYPFYDATLARQPGYIVDEAFVSEVRRIAGTPEAQLSTEASPDVSVSTFTVTATASSASDARNAANAAAELLVIRNRDDVGAGIERDIATLTVEIADQQQRLDELTATAEEAVTEFAEWQAKSSNSIEPGYADALAQRLIANVAADNARRQVSDAQGDLDRIVSAQTDLATELSLVDSEVAIGSPAEAANATERLPVELVFAAAFGLIGLLLVPSVERRFGKLRSATSLERLWPSVPIVDSSHQSGLVPNMPLAWKRSQRNTGEAAIFLGFPDESVAGDFISIAGGVDDTFDAVTVLGAGAHSGQGDELWNGDLHLVVERSKTTIREITALQTELETLGLVPQTVILHGD